MQHRLVAWNISSGVMLPMVSFGGVHSKAWTGALRQHEQLESWQGGDSTGVESASLEHAWPEQHDIVTTGAVSAGMQQEPNAAAFRTQQHMGIAITMMMAMERWNRLRYDVDIC